MMRWDAQGVAPGIYVYELELQVPGQVIKIGKKKLAIVK
jgi:hypothetical protein